MKIFCLIFLTVLGTSLAVPARSRSRNENLYSRLEKDSFESQLSEFLEACSLTDDDLTGALERVLEKAEEIDMDHTHVCECIEEHFIDIVQPVTDLIDTHCNQNTNLGNVAKALALSVQSVSAYICGSNGKHLMELLHPCIFNDDAQGESDQDCVEGVIGEYESKMEDYMRRSNLVNFMCESMDDAYERCIKSKLNQRCKMQMTRDAFTELVDAIMDPCNEEARLMK